jgi:hypothetical protein
MYPRGIYYSIGSNSDCAFWNYFIALINRAKLRLALGNYNTEDHRDIHDAIGASFCGNHRRTKAKCSIRQQLKTGKFHFGKNTIFLLGLTSYLISLDTLHN